MKNLRNYIALIGEMFSAREMKNEEGEEEVLDKLDIVYKNMSTEERDKENEMIFFGSKEKFFNFTKAWKQFIADKKHRKYKVAYDACNGKYVRVDGKWKCKEPINSYYWQTDLRIEHHVLYALLRNKPLKKMFKKDKTQTGSYGGLCPYWPLHGAYTEISWAAKDGNPKYLEPLLKPFGDTISLYEVQLAANKLQRIYLKTNHFKDLDLE